VGKKTRLLKGEILKEMKKREGRKRKNLFGK